MNTRTPQQKEQRVLANRFPRRVYPVLYKAYWNEDLDDQFKLENNKTGLPLQAIMDVYKSYYNLNFDSSTLNITYNNDKTPYCIVFIVYYLYRGRKYYIWEYFDNWMTIYLNNK